MIPAKGPIQEDAPARGFFPPPRSAGGAMLATFGLATLVVGVALVTQNADQPLETALLGLLMCSPTAILAYLGHFGTTRWRLPTIGGFIYLSWQAGLGPSLVTVSPFARRLCHFSDEAVLAGRFTYLAWFVVYALTLWRAPPESPPQARAYDVTDTRPTLLGAAFAVLAWTVGAWFAAKHDMLSFWRSSAAESGPATGSLEMSAVLLYNILTPLLAPLALLFVLRTRGTWRIAALAVFGAGVVFLFIFSSRRLWFIAIYLCLAIAFHCRGRIKRSWIMGAVTIGLLGAGPLLWSYRQLRRSGEREGQQAISQVWDAVVGYATSDEARSEANEWGETNMSQRFGIGGVLYGAAEHVLSRGPNYSPTMVGSVVRWVPTMLWADKNQLADDLDPKFQLIATGRFPHVDIPVSPITELVFQIGFWLAPLGAAAYALAARAVSHLGRSAMTSVPRFLIWAGVALALCFFDGAFVQVISPLRELLVLAAGAWAADALARRARSTYDLPSSYRVRK